MRRTRMFTTERFVIFYNEFAEALDLYVWGTEPPQDFLAYTSAGAVQFDITERASWLNPAIPTRNPPNIAPSAWRSIRMKHSSWATVPATVLVCVYIKNAAYLSASLGLEQPLINTIMAAPPGVEVVMDANVYHKWNPATGAGRQDTAGLEQHTGAIQFIDTPAFRGLFGGPPV